LIALTMTLALTTVQPLGARSSQRRNVGVRRTELTLADYSPVFLPSSTCPCRGWAPPPPRRGRRPRCLALFRGALLGENENSIHAESSVRTMEPVLRTLRWAKRKGPPAPLRHAGARRWLDEPRPASAGHGLA